MGRMTCKSGVRDPRDRRAFLEILGERQCVLGVSLSAQAERLGTQKQLLSSKGVEAGTEIAQDLNSGADDERNVSKCLKELKTVVALGRLMELREALGVGSPVKLARVNNDTSDGSSVASNPLGCRVNNDICAVVDRADKVATSAKRVVDLAQALALWLQGGMYTGY